MSMEIVMMYIRDGRPVCYPGAVPVDTSARVNAYPGMTTLGRAALQRRADAAGRSCEPVIAAGVTRQRRDELLGAYLARESGR